MNRIEKEGFFENIYFNGYVARAVKRGDVILRPILVDTLLDRLINWIMPGNFEHAMLYLGDGMLLNPYPDRKGVIHKEHLFDNLSWRNFFTSHPKLLTFARITEDALVVEAAINALEESLKAHASKGYCSSVIVNAFVHAGIPHNTFEASHVGAHILSTVAVRSFDTGYEISQAAQQRIPFQRISHK